MKFTSNSSCGGKTMNWNRLFGIRAPAAASECHQWRCRQVFITSQRVYVDRELYCLLRRTPHRAVTFRYSLRFTTEIKENVDLNSYFTRVRARHKILWIWKLFLTGFYILFFTIGNNSYWQLIKEKRFPERIVWIQSNGRNI